MPSPYSEDFRQKVIAAVERGEGKTKVSRMMNISRNTLDLWLKRKQDVGNCQAITHYQQGCGHKITDWQRFREFAKQHGDKTQAQMAKLWEDMEVFAEESSPAKHSNVSQQNISDALRKIGMSRKKDLWISRTR